MSTFLFSNPRVEEDISLNAYYTDNRVLVGNWVQRRFKFIKHRIPKETVYMIDYKENPVDLSVGEENANLVADRVVNNYGMPVAATMDDEHYSCNFATLYDLNYNRAWKWPRCVRDYTLNEVNAVNYGLLDSKKKVWEQDLNPKSAYITESKMAYVPHNVPTYGIRRQSSELESPSSICRMFVDQMDFKSREERICYCPEHPNVCAIKPRNPINILPGL